MLEYVSGRLEERGADWVVIDLRGLGLRISVPSSTAEALPASGSEVKLWTHLYVREDIRAIYGFATAEERALFLLLLGVSGVGAKTALSALSMYPPQHLAAAIDSGDETALTRVQGLGKKTASMIVLNLKGKLPAFGTGGVAAAVADGSVLDALLGLGLSRPEAATLLATLPLDPERSEEETLRLAFQAYNSRSGR